MRKKQKSIFGDGVLRGNGGKRKNKEEWWRQRSIHGGFRFSNLKRLSAVRMFHNGRWEKLVNVTGKV